MKNPYVSAMKRLLVLVIKNKTFFTKNPAALAWVMAQYDVIHYSSRCDEDEELHDWENPKYAVEDLVNKVGEAYANLIYDAWTMSPIGERHGKGHPALWYKKNKTMQDFIKIGMKEFPDLFPTPESVISHNLTAIGNGTDWNKDGYIFYPGPSGVDLGIFKGFEKGNQLFTKKLQSEVEKVIGTEKIKSAMKAFSKTVKEDREQRDKEYQMMKEFNKKYNHLVPSEKKVKAKPEPKLMLWQLHEEYSKLCSMPDNAHPSYVKAGIKLCEEALKEEEIQDPANVKLLNKFLAKWKK